MHHLEDIGDELAFHLAPGLGVEIGHLDEVIFLQDLLGKPRGSRRSRPTVAMLLPSLPRLCIWTEGRKMCLPDTGTLAAKPVTPQPPSSSPLTILSTG